MYTVFIYTHKHTHTQFYKIRRSFNYIMKMLLLNDQNIQVY